MGDYLIHYRTPGSKNGVRKYQYKDGSLTPAGKIRYLKGTNVGPEYEQELEFNSQQNIYPSNKPKSKPARSRPNSSKADQLNKKNPQDHKGKDRQSKHIWYDNENDTWREQRIRDSSGRKPLRIDTAAAMLVGGVKEELRKVIDATRNKTKELIKNYFDKSFGEHFGYQAVPPKGSDGINHLIPYTNKEAAEALSSYITSTSTGKMGNYINTFIQTAQMNVANGCARFLDSIGMDDEVYRFLKKLGIKDNNDMIK